MITFTTASTSQTNRIAHLVKVSSERFVENKDDYWHFLDDEFDCQTIFDTCIPQTKKCDGKQDCVNGLDELSCENMPCSEEEFPCYGREHVLGCIKKVQVCDGTKNCIDGRDEANCTTTASSSPKVYLACN